MNAGGAGVSGIGRKNRSDSCRHRERNDPGCFEQMLAKLSGPCSRQSHSGIPSVVTAVGCP